MADKPDFAAMNRAAGERLQDVGAQLSMFAADGAPVGPEARRPGRPAGAGNKLKGKLRDLATARGYRDPAEQLAMIAGLDRPDVHPLAYAGQIAELIGEPVLAVAGMMRQAAAELMPYWHAKLTPDVTFAQTVVPILMQMPGAAPGQVIEGMAGAMLHPYAPLDVRAALTQRNQGLSGSDDAGGGDAIRTDEVST